MGLGPPTQHENGLAYAGRGSGNVALSWYARVRNESDVGAFGTRIVAFEHAEQSRVRGRLLRAAVRLPPEVA